MFNRIGMALLLCAIAKISGQQQMPTIKGHTLGETVNEYVSKTSGGSEALKRCRDATTPKDAKKDEWCQPFLFAMDKGARYTARLDDKEFTARIRSTDDTATFDQGRVVAMDIQNKHATYAEMLIDMKTRLGEPSNIEEVVSQNGYGATFHHPSATWSLPDVYATMREASKFEDDIGYYNITFLTILTASERDRLLKEKANRVDTLK